MAVTTVYCLHGFLGEPSDWNGLEESLRARETGYTARQSSPFTSPRSAGRIHRRMGETFLPPIAPSPPAAMAGAFS